MLVKNNLAMEEQEAIYPAIAIASGLKIFCRRKNPFRSRARLKRNCA